MRINKMDNVFHVYNKNTSVNKVKTDKTAKDTDQLKISENAVEFQYGLQKLKNVEDIRMDKVERIKAQIKSGTYHVDGKQIAEKILDSISFDKKM
jgi:negative regulator of flagellin synthesis FlgM